MKIYLLDRNNEMIQFWRLSFSGISRDEVEIVCDDFGHFMQTRGKEIDCVVSPANSYGLMDGGYDAAISLYFGEELVPAVQSYIREHYFCEQPVGTSFIMQIPNSPVRLIHTPTMRVPSVIRDPLVVYHCMRSTLITAMKGGVGSIVIPAFGGHCGKVPLQTIALLMRAAYDQLRNMPESMDWLYAYSRRLEGR